MSLLSVSSIAVIGASADETKVGHIVLKNIVTQGFKGKIYPVNPKGGEILGLVVKNSVTDIDGTVDAAMIVTPAKTVPGILEECGKKGIKTVIVISAGFAEMGTDEGHALEKELVMIAKKHTIDLVGPNCLGVMRPSIGLNASFAENVDRSGHIALLSQSGALAVALLDAAGSLNMNFSLMVSMGNKAAMNECDFLEACADDPETHVIGMYVESIVDGKRFLSVAKDVAAKKPIVLIKSGISERGKKAVSSHTGALAGSDSAIDAVCAQTGIHRARTTDEFLDLLQVLSTQPALLTPNIAVITNAGGPGILATDAAERQKLIIAELDTKNAEDLKKILPPAASVKNPIDVLGDAVANRYAAALTACGKDPNIDGVVALLTPQVMTPCEEIAQAVIDVHAKYPLMPIVTSFMGQKNVAEAVKLLQANGIPNFPSPERAVAALAALRANGKLKIENGKYNKSFSIYHLPFSHGLLSEAETEKLFTHYDLPLPSSAIAKTEDEAAQLAQKIGFPVVAKISSPQIIHKTDIGCVKVNLKNEADVRKAFTEIMANATSARLRRADEEIILNGVLIQQMLPAGDEFIVGAIKDANFGHLVMVGLGGIYTELFKDTVFRVSPIGEDDAYAMLQELRSWKMLLGMRGKAQSDIAALAKIVAQISHLVTDCPQIKELDLNPVIVRSDGVVIADAKVIVE